MSTLWSSHGFGYECCLEASTYSVKSRSWSQAEHFQGVEPVPNKVAKHFCSTTKHTTISPKCTKLATFHLCDKSSCPTREKCFWQNVWAPATDRDGRWHFFGRDSIAWPAPKLFMSVPCFVFFNRLDKYLPSKCCDEKRHFLIKVSWHWILSDPREPEGAKDDLAH